VFSITLGHDEISLHFQPLQNLIERGTEWLRPARSRCGAGRREGLPTMP
jgi:hypothetical protein